MSALTSRRRIDAGAKTVHRDIELLYDNFTKPIDLDLDPVNRTLYWTDRGDPPRGNTVNRALMGGSVYSAKSR